VLAEAIAMKLGDAWREARDRSKQPGAMRNAADPALARKTTGRLVG